MLKFTENNEVIDTLKYSAIIVGVQTREDITYSMDELKGLAEAAGAEVIGRMVQVMERPDRATMIGSGKTLELAEMVRNMEADVVIFNDELAGMQIRNLEEATGVRVIDRTILILDIFAARADSKEGRLQVELAQLRYRLPRLTGFGKSLSRTGAGIGTRGPGEKKLETDRRHIERRIDDIRRELAKTETARATQRSKREKNEIPVVALAGYTNSGKSAIMNRLLAISGKEEKSVKEQDMLFATLDAAHRKVEMEPGREFVLIDTVGFVSKLPHGLVEAFKSTLEEVAGADLILHVIDASFEDNDSQKKVTEEVLKSIGASVVDRVIVYNKIDKLESPPPAKAGDSTLFVSAKENMNMDVLVETVLERLYGRKVKTTLIIPYDKGSIVSYLCENARIISTDYGEKGTVLELEMNEKDYRRLAEYEAL